MFSHEGPEMSWLEAEFLNQSECRTWEYCLFHLLSSASYFFCKVWYFNQVYYTMRLAHHFCLFCLRWRLRLSSWLEAQTWWQCEAKQLDEKIYHGGRRDYDLTNQLKIHNIPSSKRKPIDQLVIVDFLVACCVLGLDGSCLFKIFQQFEALQGQDVNKEEEQIFKVCHWAGGGFFVYPNFTW